MKATHNINYNEYQPKYEGQSLKKNLHDEKNCGKEVLWSAIENQLRGENNMSLNKYYETYKNGIQPPKPNALPIEPPGHKDNIQLTQIKPQHCI